MVVRVVHRIDVRDKDAFSHHKDEPAYIEVNKTTIYNDMHSGVRIVFSHDGELYEFVLKDEHAAEFVKAINDCTSI